MQEEVNSVLTEIRNNRDRMTPMRASDILLDLSFLLASANTEISERQFRFNNILSDIISDPSINVSRARIIAQAKDEFRELDKAIRLSESLEENIRSLKIWIKSRQNEFNNTFN